jgi:hypothetical protein
MDNPFRDFWWDCRQRPAAKIMPQYSVVGLLR